MDEELIKQLIVSSIKLAVKGIKLSKYKDVLNSGYIGPMAASLFQEALSNQDICRVLLEIE